MPKIIETKQEFDDLLKDSGEKLVVVDFYADWCGPCKNIAAPYEELSKKFSNAVFVKVNVDENEDTAAAEGVSAMPTFKLYKNGKKVDELVGANMPKLEELVKKYA